LRSLLRFVRSISRVLISFKPWSVLPVGNVVAVGVAAGDSPDSRDNRLSSSKALVTLSRYLFKHESNA
jgi:hypothetical protein